MPKKILLVDDEPDLRDMLAFKFQKEGFEVLKADNGQQGLEMAKKEMPDVIILDEMMPKMDGLKVSGLLKSDVRFKDIPIIMFTAKAAEEDISLSKEIGIEAYMSKLTSFEELIKKVNSLIERE